MCDCDHWFLYEPSADLSESALGKSRPGVELELALMRLEIVLPRCVLLPTQSAGP